REGDFLDARLLSAADHKEGLKELLALPPMDGAPVNLEERLAKTFGSVFTRELFAPIMRKYTGQALVDLGPDAHLLFGLNRVIAGRADETISLKSADPWHDARLAFHDSAKAARP